MQLPWWGRRGTIIALIIVVLTVILPAIFLRGPISNVFNKPTAQYQTQAVKQGDLSITIGATGPMQSSVYNLTFSGTGTSSARIEEINVAVGQKVKKSQRLAIIDKTILQNTYNQQLAIVQADQNNMAAAQNSLGTTQGVGTANVAADQTALASDQQALLNAQTSAQATINLDQTTLNNDQAALNATQQQVNQSNAAANAQLAVDKDTCTQKNTTPATSTSPATVAEPQRTNCNQLAQSTYNKTIATNNQNLQLAQAKVTADQQRLNLDTATGNANIQTAQSRVNTDQARINTDQASANNSSASSQSSVTSLQSKLNQDLTQLAAYKRDMDNAILLAPHDGVVTVINGNVGGIPGVPANASSASTTTTASTFIQLVDTQALQVQANVNETDTGSLQVGDAATFTVNAFNGRTFIGTVSAISPNGQTVSNVVTYPVTIDVNASSLQGANLLPNMTANVTITVVQHSGVLLIPVEAVNFARLSSTSNPTTGRQALVESKAVAQAMRRARQLLANLESNNADIVAVSPIPTFVLEKPDDNFVVKPVVLGLTDGTQYEVLDGLTTNDVIVDGNRTGEQFGRPGGTNTTAQGG